MNLRRKSGATLGLVAVLLLTIALIGACFFFLARTFGGGRQCMNATDAGVLTAARSMLAIAVPRNNVASEFQGLGVNVHTGEPDPTNGSMNIFAYNRAAGAALLIAMNAAADGNAVGIGNANTVINNLNTFGNQLNTAIINSGRMSNTIAQDFETTATGNNVNMMGQNTATHLTADLDFKSVQTGGSNDSKSNVYFNTAVLNDPSLSALVPQAQATAGQINSVAAPDSNAVHYALPPLYQEGQPLLKAYQPIKISPLINPIFLTAVNPASQPHLIDAPRFATAPARIGNAPVNSVQGLSMTIERNAGNKSQNPINALACAVVGAIYNQYPITISHGYVRLHNGPDARVANPALGGVFGSVDGKDSIFNNALYHNAPGGGGIYSTDNNVFTTRFSTQGLAEIQAYITYNTTGSGGRRRGRAGRRDPNGKLPMYDPQVGQEFTADIRQQFAREYSMNPYRRNPFYPPNQYGSLRYGSTYGELATPTQLLAIQSLPTFCTDLMYNGSSTPQSCSNNLSVWRSNYEPNGSSGTPAGPQYTNLEALKAKVITEWVAATQSNNFGQYSFTTDGGMFANPSGSKVYQRTGVAYASPTNTATGTAAFGTPGTPYALLKQLKNNASTCVDPEEAAQWNNPNTILGKLFIRCREIAPAVTWTGVRDLLKNHIINLDEHQYLYSPDGGLSLTISAAPPSFLAGSPEQFQPGITRPDGTLVPNCSDSPFNGVIGNVVNARKGVNGNAMGDNNLHDTPFQTVTKGPGSFNGILSTSDFVNFQSSSGKDNILGELSFGNQVNANARFSSPN